MLFFSLFLAHDLIQQWITARVGNISANYKKPSIPKLSITGFQNIISFTQSLLNCLMFICVDYSFYPFFIYCNSLMEAVYLDLTFQFFSFIFFTFTSVIAFFLLIIYLKSMKFFAIGTALLTLAFSKQSLECGQGQVTNKFNICIQPNYIEGCQQYQSSEICSECQIGYKLSKGLCDAIEYIERDPKMIGCLKKSENGKACLNCANGFVKKNEGCQVGIKNCLKYHENSCSQCKPNYSFVMGECRFNVVLGCKKMSVNHICEQCYSPFLLKNSHCQLPNCQTINDYGCVTCQCGFYLNKDRTCVKSDSGCLRYQRSRCIDCLNHYRLKGGVCEIEGCVRYQGNTCLECKEQYNHVNGGCQFKNCEDWGNDQCYSCKKGFKKQGKTCQKETEVFYCTD